MTQFALTTNDNPYNPLEDDFKLWYSFDMEKGYDCAGKLMREAKTTDDMTDIEENAEIERAIDVIIRNDFRGIYKKVSKKLTIPEE